MGIAKGLIGVFLSGALLTICGCDTGNRPGKNDPAQDALRDDSPLSEVERMLDAELADRKQRQEMLARNPQTAGAAKGEPPPYENWYPANIAPPPGLKYPCGIVSLMTVIHKFPPKEQPFINHVFAVVLKAAHGKMKIWKNYQTYNTNPGMDHQVYKAEVMPLLNQLRTIPAPEPGLNAVKGAIFQAIGWQNNFFGRAQPLVMQRAPLVEFASIPDGRMLVMRMNEAKAAVDQYYSNLDPQARSVLQQHLCVLDIHLPPPR